MIRQAVIGDLQNISFLVQEWYRVQEYEEQSGICIEEPVLEAMIVRMIRFPKYEIFVEQDKNGNIIGMIAGFVEGATLNPMQLVAKEMICFGKNRIAMREHFDRWANRSDATAVVRYKPTFRSVD